MKDKDNPPPKKLRQLNVSIPADRWPDLVRLAAEEQLRTGEMVSIAAWARRVILERAKAA